MFLGRGATREQIFKAASTLADRGERVTVAAVKAAVGGGANGSIREALVDWRRDRQTQPPPFAPTPGAPVPRMATPADNVVPLQAGGTGLPGDVRALVDAFAQQLHRAWMDALAANTSPDDQMAVIRAAAEARMREEGARLEDLEATLNDAHRRTALLEQENASLVSALDIAHQEMEITENGGAHGRPGDAAEIARLNQALDAARAEITRLNTELDARAGAAQVMAKAVAIDPADPAEAAPEAKPAAASALREALRSAEEMRDLMRAERDRLQAELDAGAGATADDSALAADLADARAALKETRAALRDAEAARDAAVEAKDGADDEKRSLESMIEKQAAWIEQARGKLDAAGLLKTAEAA